MLPQCTPPEEWRPIPGYEDIYSVSCLGRVRRDRGGQGARAGYILSSPLNSNGYPQLRLWRNGTKRSYVIHRLVAAAFLGPEPLGMEVNHKNGIKSDPAATNLEYVTRPSNSAHAYATGLKDNRGERHPHHKLTLVDVAAIRTSDETIRALAQRYGVHHGTIWAIKIGRTWRHVT